MEIISLKLAAAEAERWHNEFNNHMNSINPKYSIFNLSMAFARTFGLIPQLVFYLGVILSLGYVIYQELYVIHKELAIFLLSFAIFESIFKTVRCFYQFINATWKVVLSSSPYYFKWFSKSFFDWKEVAVVNCRKYAVPIIRIDLPIAKILEIPITKLFETITLYAFTCTIVTIVRKNRGNITFQIGKNDLENFRKFMVEINKGHLITVFQVGKNYW